MAGFFMTPSNLPGPLVESILAGRCVLFVGSGLSAQIKRSDGRPLPTWKQLLEELIAAAGIYIDALDAQDMSTAVWIGQLIQVAESLQESIPEDFLQHFFNQVFGDGALHPGPNHTYIPRIRLRAVLTSNYDSLLEQGFKDVTGSQPLTLTFDTFLSAKCPLREPQFFILKIHGDFRNAANIVLGVRNYQTIIHHHPLSRLTLKNIFNSYTVLFVGYGAADPDLDDVLNSLAIVLRHSSMPHYMILPEDRFTALERRRLLFDQRLQVIEYDPVDDHRLLTELIRTLQHVELLNSLHSNETKPRVLIAIHRNDLQRLDDFLDALESRGFSYQYLDLSELWQANVLDRTRADVERSAVVVHVTSINYNKDFDFIIAAAYNADRPLVPVILDDVAVPQPLRRFFCVRFSERDREGSVERLADLIGQHAELANHTAPA
jgi:hypothetical protein